MRDWRTVVALRLPHAADSVVSELSEHLEQAYADGLAAGLSEDEAAARAEARLLDWRGIEREIRHSERRAGPFSGLLQDLRQSLRFFRTNPGFAAIAVATLAFGIGGNTAIFTMADALALRGLPYPEANRLMAVESYWTKQPEIEPWTSTLDLFDLRSRAKSFTSIAAIGPIWNDILAGPRGAERLETLYVSANFFPLLGAHAELGRTFDESEDRGIGGKPVAVLSHAFWQRMGARRDILGRAITINGAAFTVIGVTPSGFRYLGEPLAGKVSNIDVWMPLGVNPIVGTPRGLRFLKLVAQLRPGVTPETADAEVRGIGQSLGRQFPASNENIGMRGATLESRVSGPHRVTAMLLLGAVGFVLLMACANVASLLLARAAVRRKDAAVRAALGASRYRLLRQLLAEGFVMALAGGAAGLALAYAGVRLLASAAPGGFIAGGALRLDWRSFAFTAAAVFLCTLAAGLPPAWSALSRDLQDALRQAGRGLTRANHRLRASLVVLEVATALALLAGAGLLIRSFTHVLDISPGFDAHNLLTISTQMPTSAARPEQREAIYRRMRDNLLGVPGVTNVEAVSRLPLSGVTLGTSVLVEGRPRVSGSGPDVEYRRSTPGYFAAMHIPLLRGRLFDEHDRPSAGPLAVISESMERGLWHGESAIGQRVKLGPEPDRLPWTTIIGVVGDVRHYALDAAAPATVYAPYAESPFSAPLVVIRTREGAGDLLPALEAKIRATDPNIPVYGMTSMEAMVDRSTAQRRFVMSLLTGFAIAALLLAAFGVFGAVSQSVAQRTQEIGLRMALGSSPREAVAMVFCDGMKLAWIGAALGLAAAAGLTRLLRSLLFEVQPLDPLSFAGAALTLLAFAALACYLPARRATRVDPLIALRQE
jgi:predicted permease